MTPNRVQVAIEKYGKKIPADSITSFKRHLMDADDSCMDEFMFLTVKSPLTTILFSIFLGGIGVDWFYLKNTSRGLVKIFLPLILSIIAAVLTAVAPPIGIIANLALRIGVLIWRIVDCFNAYKYCKSFNYDSLTGYLHLKRKKYSKSANTSAYSYEEERRAQVESGEYTPLFSNYKPVYANDTVESTPNTVAETVNESSSSAQATQEEGSSEIASPIAIDTPDIDIIFTCPVCSQKMRITTVASKYCCPKCSTIFPYKNVVK